MKMYRHFLAIVALLGLGMLSLHAVDKKHLSGPKGGRLLETTVPRAEFLLQKDQNATIFFYDAELKPVPATDQAVAIIAETQAGKTKIEFEKKGDVLVSRRALPEGDGYNLVVQFRQTDGARPQNFRFKLETHRCEGCQRAEYACICDE